MINSEKKYLAGRIKYYITHKTNYKIALNELVEDGFKKATIKNYWKTLNKID